MNIHGVTGTQIQTRPKLRVLYMLIQRTTFVFLIFCRKIAVSSKHSGNSQLSLSPFNCQLFFQLAFLCFIPCPRGHFSVCNDESELFFSSSFSSLCRIFSSLHSLESLSSQRETLIVCLPLTPLILCCLLLLSLRLFKAKPKQYFTPCLADQLLRTVVFFYLCLKQKT